MLALEAEVPAQWDCQCGILLRLSIMGRRFVNITSLSHRDLIVRLAMAVMSALVLLALVSIPSRQALAEPPRRDVVPGYPTTKLIPGVPYDMLGSRIVFTNWAFVQPGDLDWKWWEIPSERLPTARRCLATCIGVRFPGVR